MCQVCYVMGVRACWGRGGHTRVCLCPPPFHRFAPSFTSLDRTAKQCLRLSATMSAGFPQQCLEAFCNSPAKHKTLDNSNNSGGPSSTQNPSAFRTVGDPTEGRFCPDEACLPAGQIFRRTSDGTPYGAWGRDGCSFTVNIFGREKYRCSSSVAHCLSHGEQTEHEDPKTKWRDLTFSC